MTADTDILIDYEAVLQDTLLELVGLTEGRPVDRDTPGVSGLLEYEVELGVLLELLLEGVAHVTRPCRYV